jgi:5-methylcytosine-specific restriction endonuclease McrA
MPCSKCQSENWGFYTSSSTLKVKTYCKTCRQNRASEYSKRQKSAAGSHTNKQWLTKLSLYDKCPSCNRAWEDISPRPDKRYKNVWTKDHIIPLNKGGADHIENIQPLCYQCNFSKR